MRHTPQILAQDIPSLIRPHRVPDDSYVVIQEVTDSLENIALLLARKAPPSRARDVALEHLVTTKMWAVNAISQEGELIYPPVATYQPSPTEDPANPFDQESL